MKWWSKITSTFRLSWVWCKRSYEFIWKVRRKTIKYTKPRKKYLPSNHHLTTYRCLNFISSQTCRVNNSNAFLTRFHYILNAFSKSNLSHTPTHNKQILFHSFAGIVHLNVDSWSCPFSSFMRTIDMCYYLLLLLLLFRNANHNAPYAVYCA